MDKIDTNMLILIGVLLIFLLILKVFKVSLKIILKFAINALVGGIILYAVNYIPGINLEITWINATLTGIFGIPAVIVILILYFIKK